MNNAQIRDAVKAMYPNQNWAAQVDRMADDQIVAIYLKNLQDPSPLPEKEKPPEQGQLF
ncbi:MAG TPA: hypothetical protein VH187_16550 [Scandinavium sp.]|uniref:hypothetical protein n=1 Tax=Scandinavium sp. TaxID=2830653 RepID=UPI002E326736|nr:hypothetical protein [Scandinavium sp.]HEX4502748.1 hypothetical protein [Scandinavium sp.]